MSSEAPKLDSNPQEAMRLAREVFTPALQQACNIARAQKAQDVDIINGAINAHANMLIQLIGYDAAIGLMKAHADHLTSVKDNPYGSRDESGDA